MREPALTEEVTQSTDSRLIAPINLLVGVNEMSIIKGLDQHLQNYIVYKELHPDSQLVLRAFKKQTVDRVDRIIELAHGQRDFVTSENDWKIVEELILFFAAQWPNEFLEFKQSIPEIRQSRNSGGYSDSREMVYVGAIPPRLMKLVKAIFPAQQWDKKFVNKFVKRFKLFKVGGEGN